MPSELICNLRGGWRRQVVANAVARQEFLIALQELDEAQQELNSMRPRRATLTASSPSSNGKRR